MNWLALAQQLIALLAAHPEYWQVVENLWNAIFGNHPQLAPHDAGVRAAIAEAKAKAP